MEKEFRSAQAVVLNVAIEIVSNVFLTFDIDNIILIKNLQINQLVRSGLQQAGFRADI